MIKTVVFLAQPKKIIMWSWQTLRSFAKNAQDDTVLVVILTIGRILIAGYGKHQDTSHKSAQDDIAPVVILTIGRILKR